MSPHPEDKCFEIHGRKGPAVHRLQDLALPPTPARVLFKAGNEDGEKQGLVPKEVANDHRARTGGKSCPDPQQTWKNYFLTPSMSWDVASECCRHPLRKWALDIDFCPDPSPLLCSWEEWAEMGPTARHGSLQLGYPSPAWEPLIWGGKTTSRQGVEGEARVLVVGSGMGVSSLPGTDQSHGPVFASIPPGLWPTRLSISTLPLLSQFKCILVTH